MYREITKDKYGEAYGVSSDYSIEGFLCFGDWKMTSRQQLFYKVLDELNFKWKKISHRKNFLFHNVIDIQIEDKNYWFGCYYGSAMLSEHAHLASIFGSKKNILIGSFGGLPNSQEFDFVIPTASNSSDSSAVLYEPSIKHLSNPKLSKEINSSLAKEWTRTHGEMVTCQAMLAETQRNINDWSKHGYFGVDMESACLFAVSRALETPAAALLINADQLHSNETVLDKTYSARKKLLMRREYAMFEAAIKVLLS